MGMKSMKAAYETPKVSFEAFMANNAVSVCVQKPSSFDCVMHGDKNNDGYDLDFGFKVPNCEPSGNVVSKALGMSGCTAYAGFADLVGNGHADDNDNWKDDVSGLSHSLLNDENIMNSTTGYDQQTKKYDQDLLGWLYITFSPDSSDSSRYTTNGWNTGSGYLSFIKKEAQVSGWHAWLAPLFGTKATSGM